MEVEYLVELLKNELLITWEEDETNLKLTRIVTGGIQALNYKLGAEIDYTESGLEQEVFLAYCVYAYNGCLNEFDEAYQNNIMQIRHKYEVQSYIAENGDDNEE
ncbi:MAG: hypothetical protein ACI3VR_06575 [Intestinibacter sp.]|uniref:hypothetical protein n=1 Tax=Intestinibacter sp. TaxID=1965304 RepID=UPI003F161CD7